MFAFVDQIIAYNTEIIWEAEESQRSADQRSGEA